MRKLHMLTTAAAALLAITGSSLAAHRTLEKSHTHAKSSVESQSRAAKSSGSIKTWYGVTLPPYSPTGTSDYPWGPGFNLPYPDRPYGNPDHW